MVNIRVVVQNYSVSFNPGMGMKFAFLPVDANTDLTGNSLAAQKVPERC